MTGNAEIAGADKAPSMGILVLKRSGAGRFCRDVRRRALGPGRFPVARAWRERKKLGRRFADV